jgi:hypothetical protein
VPSLSELALLGGVGGNPCLDVRKVVSFPSQIISYSSTSMLYARRITSDE